eukprot:g7256.t1
MPMNLKCLCATFGVLAGAAATEPTRPHVLFVVIDDLGWDDVGFRSHQVRTPTVDAMAADGVVLNQYYVQDVCSPSRATFMTGRYPLHHTVNDWLRNGVAMALPLNETTMAQRFREAGYRTHAIGKWHLGFTKWAHTPTFRGFESFYGFYSGGQDYFTHGGSTYDFHREAGENCGANCSQVAWEASGSYSTSLFSGEAVDVVRAHDASKPAEPLFLYLAFQAVHAPSEVPQSYKDAYNGSIADPHRLTFAGMLSCMDEGLGNVTAALEAKGMLENTLVVFTTDNGGPVPDTPGGDYVGSRNFPLKGGKHSIWEGGTRGTALVHSASRALLPNATRRGIHSDNLMHASDWFPTLCRVGGLRCDDLPFDGHDQWDAIAAGAPSPRAEVLYGRHDDAPEESKPYDDALRDAEGWKLIYGWGGKPDSTAPPVNASSAGAGVGEGPAAVSGGRVPAGAGAGAGAGACSVALKRGVCMPGNDIGKPV